MTITGYNPTYIYIVKTSNSLYYKFYNGEVYRNKPTLELALQEVHPLGATGSSLSCLSTKNIAAIYTPDLNPELFI